jgi:hypothetical protein
MPVDHLVYAAPSLAEGLARMSDLLGVAAIPGGSHPGLGTCNAIVPLGRACYLEIIAPDPAQGGFTGTRPFGIDDLEGAQLLTWAARRPDLRAFVEAARGRGISMSEATPMSRETGAGDMLHWELAFVTDTRFAGVAPFLIDWGNTPHPASGGVEGAALRSLELLHQDLEQLEKLRTALELEVEVGKAPSPGLRVVIECTRGEVELRSGC